MLSERDYITRFRACVERQLLLGNNEGRLRQRDFEYLAKLIEEKSKVRLSLSTLKRLWKNDHSQEPHPATLDALASLLEFDSWQAFKKSQLANEMKDEAVVEPFKRKKRMAWPIAAALSVLVVSGVFLIVQGFDRSAKKLVLPDNIIFKADKTVTSGVPNTVLFTYDIKDVKADSFFIQQSWNPRDKVRIDPARNYLSSIYYYPGFHRAKLIVNDSIVKRERIHIKTNGWMPIVQYVTDDTPYYLEGRKIFQNGNMVTPKEVLDAANIDISKRFILRYYNIRDFDGVNSDNFSIETRFKHDSVGKAICPFAILTIHTEEHIYYVEVTNKGCVGDLSVKIGEVEMSSRDTNLSGLGANIYEWQTLRIENRDKHATLYLNDVEAIKITYNKDFGKIVGLTYTFNGTGSVDYVSLKDGSANEVYRDDFERPMSNLISQE